MFIDSNYKNQEAYECSLIVDYKIIEHLYRYHIAIKVLKELFMCEYTLINLQISKMYEGGPQKTGIISWRAGPL